MSGDMAEKINPFFTEKAYNISCLIRPGKIASIEGREELAALSSVKHCFYSYNVGDELPQEIWGRLAQIFLRLQVVGGEQGYSEVADFLKHRFKVLDVNGEDLLLNRGICK